MSAITRTMRDAIHAISTTGETTHAPAILSQCVEAGLLVEENGEYTPTAAGFTVSADHGQAVEKTRIRSRFVARARHSQWERGTLRDLVAD
jgi:hypothetical protein